MVASVFSAADRVAHVVAMDFGVTDDRTAHVVETVFAATDVRTFHEVASVLETAARTFQVDETVLDA